MLQGKEKGLRKVIATAALACMVMAVLSPAAAMGAPDSNPGRYAAAPAGLRAIQRSEDAGMRIALTWQQVAGVSGYRVYRSDSEDGPFLQVGGKAADSWALYPVFLDEGVEPGRAYFYRVTAIDAEWRESAPSGTVRVEMAPAASAAGGAKSMTCSLSDQRIYFFEGDQLVNIVRCSTGLSNATPTGNFRILGHYGTHAGLGGAICDYWMAFTPSHGMHAWPRGNRNYESGLGAPASHGCIRLHPLEAYWPYNWAPNGTPLTVTYASLARRVISGCHSSVGAAEPSPEWYFAEGYTAEGYDTYLLLCNPGESAAVAEITFCKESGEVLEQPCAIAPHSRFTLTVDDVPGMDAAAFSTRVRADRPIVAERAMYFAAGSRNDGTVSIGATELSTDWYFAEGYTAESFDTYLLLANPGDEAVSAWVYFFLEGGATADFVFWVNPHSRFTMPVDAYPVVGSAAFSVHVHADGPIVAERAMYFNKGYTDGGHATIGATHPSASWYFAEGCTRSFFESYILVGNPGDEAAFLAVDFYLNEGSMRYNYLLQPRSRITIPVASQGGLSNTEMAFTVFSDHPVVAERAMYYSLDSHKGGDVTIGCEEASRRWYFAEGYTDNAFDTYVLLSNPSFSTAFVRVEFQRDDGATFVHEYMVPAQRRVTVGVDGLPGLERASFSTVVSSDVPVMAERAMYFVLTRGY